MSKKTARVLSLGAGVQSSALLLLADRGLVSRPDFAVFADTGAEPKSVYDWLDFLQTKVSIPIHRTLWRNLYDDVMSYRNEFHPIPAFTVSPEGKKGIGRRQCTYSYKIEPVHQEIRRQLGYVKRQRMKHLVEVQIGISKDEFQRMKASRMKWVTNEFPLIYEVDYTRKHCIDFVQNTLGKSPPRSACTFCPYHTNEEWIHLRDNEPEAWAQALKVDDAIRSVAKSE